MPKIITLTQAVRRKVTIESNGNLLVEFSLCDAQGKEYRKEAVQFMQESPTPPDPDPSWTLMAPAEIAKVNSLLLKIDEHLATFLV